MIQSSALRVLSAQDPDEIILINISKSQQEINLSQEIIEHTVGETDVPLTIGGGITSLADATKLINMGVEKVLITSALRKDPKLVTEIADKFGSQSVVAGVEYEDQISSRAHGQNHREDIKLILDYSQELVSHGAGELLLVSKSRDGVGRGLDTELLGRVANSIRIPVTGMGGVGNFDQLVEGFLVSGLSAIACGSLFTLGDNNPIRARAYLANNNVTVRKLK